MFLLDKLNRVAFMIGDIQIYWYAIMILIGALTAYITIREIVGKAGYSKDMIDTLFLVCFPVGIIGARIWWCIADASSPIYNGNFWGIFTDFRNGGLAIQGGVVAGVLCGILILKRHYKGVPISFIADSAVPNILIAQAIGRWGNFFNQEVYGECVDKSALSWLPQFIQDQMAGGGSIACSLEQAAVPLFLYEAFFNFIGWVLIVFVLRIFWKKGRKGGDLTAMYFLWYGIVRMIMEPFRNSEFIMNASGTASKLTISVIVAIVFIVCAILYMVLIRVIKIKKKEPIKNG